jgi:hypothetical protein
MKFGHLIAVISVTLSMVQLFAYAGIWIYLLYMALTLNLYMQIVVITVLILTANISRSLAKKTWGMAKESGVIDVVKNEEGSEE